MSSGRRGDNPTSDSTAQFVDKRYRELEDLPREGCFTGPAVGDPHADLLKAASRRGIVTKVDTIDTDASDRKERIAWTLTETGRAKIESYTVARAHKLPCGHTGFVNDRESDYLQCKQCNGRYTREEVKAGPALVGDS